MCNVVKYAVRFIADDMFGDWNNFWFVDMPDGSLGYEQRWFHAVPTNVRIYDAAVGPIEDIERIKFGSFVFEGIRNPRKFKVVEIRQYEYHGIGGDY